MIAWSTTYTVNDLSDNLTKDNANELVSSKYNNFARCKFFLPLIIPYRSFWAK